MGVFPGVKLQNLKPFELNLSQLDNFIMTAGLQCVGTRIPGPFFFARKCLPFIRSERNSADAAAAAAAAPAASKPGGQDGKITKSEAGPAPLRGGTFLMKGIPHGVPSFSAGKAVFPALARMAKILSGNLRPPDFQTGYPGKFRAGQTSGDCSKRRWIQSQFLWWTEITIQFQTRNEAIVECSYTAGPYFIHFILIQFVKNSQLVPRMEDNTCCMHGVFRGTLFKKPHMPKETVKQLYKRKQPLYLISYNTYTGTA